MQNILFILPHDCKSSWPKEMVSYNKTIQGGEVGVDGELAQPLVGKEPGFFHASLPNLSIFEKRYIYSYKCNIWESELDDKMSTSCVCSAKIEATLEP